MSSKTLELGRYYKINFKALSGKVTEIEFSREGKYLTRLMLTAHEIALFKENLEWLESQLLLQEKLEYDNPIERDFYDHGDECC